MNNKQSSIASNNAPIEIDILKILSALWDRALLIVLAALIGGAAMLSYSFFLVKPMYSANVLVYVNKNSVSISDMSLTLSNSEDVLSTYIRILNSRTTLNEIADTAGVNYSVETLEKMITVNSSSSDKSNFLDIDVTSGNPAEAERIANTIASVLPTRVADIVDGSSLRVVDYAVMPSKRVSDSLVRNAAIGALAGAFIVCAVVALGSIIQSNNAPAIGSPTELSTLYPEVPVLGVIKDLSYSEKKQTRSRTGYGGNYYDKYSDYYSYSAARDENGEAGAGKKKDAAARAGHSDGKRSGLHTKIGAADPDGKESTGNGKE